MGGQQADPHGGTTIIAESRSGALGYLLLSLLVIAVDQLTKLAVEITRLHTPGAAFCFLAGASGWQRWLFTGLAFGVCVVLVGWLRRIDSKARMLASAVALILGGAIGNVIDRLRLGYVVDFINCHWGVHYFPAFNVADSSITVGAALLLLDAWLEAR
jgi:signal peptidase II